RRIDCQAIRHPAAVVEHNVHATAKLVSQRVLVAVSSLRYVVRSTAENMGPALDAVWALPADANAAQAHHEFGSATELRAECSDELAVKRNPWLEIILDGKVRTVCVEYAAGNFKEADVRVAHVSFPVEILVNALDGLRFGFRSSRKRFGIRGGVC